MHYEEKISYVLDQDCFNAMQGASLLLVSAEELPKLSGNSSYLEHLSEVFNTSRKAIYCSFLGADESIRGIWNLTVRSALPLHLFCQGKWLAKAVVMSCVKSAV